MLTRKLPACSSAFSSFLNPDLLTIFKSRLGGGLYYFCQSFRMLRTLSAKEIPQLALRISSLRHGTNGLLRSAAISPSALPKHFPSSSISVRHYAQPPGGGGGGGGGGFPGGFPGFSMPQQEKGAALKEYVSCTVVMVFLVSILNFVYSEC